MSGAGGLDLVVVLGITQAVAAMINKGAMTVAKFRELLVREGATAEDLAGLDARLSAAIQAREAE